MFIDMRSIPAGTAIETDICIVGAGAAGITIARAFAGSGVRVALLEGGAMEFEEESQELYGGSSVGRPYLDPTACRLRYFGGTTNHWGGWSLPLDPIDFEARDGIPHGGWPFGRSHLDPWYDRAQKVLQLGPYNYDPYGWGIRRALVPAPFDGPHFAVKMLQSSPPTRFGTVYAPELRAADGVSVYLHANALGFEADEAGRRIRALRVASPSGGQVEVRSRIYVLSSGGLENARLLLSSGPDGSQGLGNDNDLVGRFFMVHLEYSAGLVALSNPYTDFQFYTNTSSNGVVYSPFAQKFVSFIGLTEDTMRRLALPNLKIMWYFDYGPEARAIDALRRLRNEPAGGSAAADIGAIMHDLGGVGEFVFRKALSRPAIPVAALRVRFSSEPIPNPDSRIGLGDERDRFGMRRIAIDWRLSADDRRKSLATQRLLAAEIGRAGLGRMQLSTDDETSWPDDMYGNEHHIGTTRMHRDPKLGVVDENCRLHAVENLYVAGSSVFATAGAANPTLTIVALSLRLADHIKGKLA